MAVDEKVPLAVRSNLGVELWSATDLKCPYQQDIRFPREETKNCRNMVFSPDGAYFAYTNGSAVKIVDTSTWQAKWVLPRPKAFYLKFSPRGKYLCSWEQYSITKDTPEGTPNLFVYSCETGEAVFSSVQKKQTDWEPGWSSDETLFALMVGGEALFYELDKGIEGFERFAKKLGGGSRGILSIAPGHTPPNVLFYTPGAKGAPSMCKIYKYPALQAQQNIACKSFYQADRVEIMWNKRGTGVLLLTSTEVDQSGASYYGKQALHFMTIKGESCSVPLSKDGPLHAVQWSPKSNEFVVVYGFMPAKAALFNLKCDMIFDFGDSNRNSAYFNPFGNLLLLAGFGNLRGYVEVWDVNKRIKISELMAPDSTYLEWCPSGDIFVTATTAPRLRIGNGFKVWHYSGALLHETLWPQGQELLGVEWQKFGDNVFTEPAITNVKIEGIKSSQPEASKQVYQPPNVRLMLEGKSSDSVPQPSIIPGLTLGTTTKKNQSNSNRQRKHSKNQRRDSATNKNENCNTDIQSQPTQDQQQNQNNLQNQQRRRSSAANTQYQRRRQSTKSVSINEVTSNGSSTTVSNDKNNENNLSTGSGNNVNNNNNNNNGGQQTRRIHRRSHHNSVSCTGDPEKDKRIKTLYKKLSDISKLKIKQSKGEHLEANQLTKIAAETAIVEELRALKISS
ncbi:eukaryotic translation initiation factor 2A [Condylostylus longicornis]|uniref:eukaryotic translation initiation factor 2A n=1 Tax=Condylostylus longicornis TaxID=2530218 RepID=UPI00244DC715|nr:eukaryotic translation initiation factor 2A [Condylostylus longicornis]